MSEFAHYGFGMFRLLRSLKVTSLDALVVLGDRHLRQFCSTAQAAQVAPGAISELRALRRRLAQQAGSRSCVLYVEGGDAKERDVLTICAQVSRQLAAATLDRDNAAKELLRAACTKLHDFISRNVEDTVAGAQAAAGAYDEVRAALRGCPQEQEQFVREAAVPTLDAVVLSCLCLCHSGYRDREAFPQALREAFGRRVLDENLESQLHNAYSHLMESVRVLFTGATGVNARPTFSSPRASSSTAPATVSNAAASVVQIRVDLFVPISEDEFNSKKYDQSSTASFVSEKYDRSSTLPARGHPQFGKCWVNERWYFGQPKIIHRDLSTGDMWYTIEVASD